jgi:DNA-directed RNA polymerase subunit omega
VVAEREKMAEPRSSMIEPPIEDLLEQVDSKFTLVTLAARRGRQVNSYFSQLGEGLGAIVPPQVASLARKPLSIALEEIAAGKVKANFDVVLLSDEEEEGDGGDRAEHVADGAVLSALDGEAGETGDDGAGGDGAEAS